MEEREEDWVAKDSRNSPTTAGFLLGPRCDGEGEVFIVVGKPTTELRPYGIKDLRRHRVTSSIPYSSPLQRPSAETRLSCAQQPCEGKTTDDSLTSIVEQLQGTKKQPSMMNPILRTPFMN